MKQSNLVRKICSLLVLTLFTVGCQDISIPKGTVIGILDNAPRTLDPRIATDAISQNLHNLIYGALIRIDENLKVVPELCENYSQSNHSEFKFKLKKNLKFRDGSPITTVDVQASLVGLQSDNSPHTETFNKISALKIINDREFIIKTKKPEPYLLYELTLLKIYKIQNNKIITSGRYNVENFDSTSVKLSRNELFEDSNIKNVKNIILKVVSDDSTRFQLFKRGDVNVLYNALSLTLSEHLAKMSLDDKSFYYINKEGTTTGYLAFNFKNKYLALKQVRKAIAFGFDKKYYIENRIKEFGQNATSLLTKVHNEFNGQLVDYEFDQTKAIQLLDSIQLFKNPKTGIRFSLEFKTTGDKGVLDFVEIFKRYMNQIGIEIKVRSLEFGTFYADLKSGNFDLIASRWVGISHPQIYNKVFHSSQVKKLNRGAYLNKSIDSLLVQAENESNDQKRKEIYVKVQSILMEELPYLYLWHWTSTIFVKSNIEAVTPFPNSNFLTYAYLHIKE